jgi:hypothetical protein
MAIPSRQIGWGTEDNLLWQISKQLEQLTNVTAQACTTTTTTTTLPLYKVYTALFTQSGTNAPVATIISNTLGLTLTWGRSSAGNYFGGDIASQCPDGKTVFITSNSSNGGAFGTDPKEAYLWTVNSGASRFLNFNIKSINSSGASTSVDWNSPKAILIEIRVYN